MPAVKKSRFYRLMITVLGMLLLAGTVNLTAPAAALAEPSTSLEITGDGVATPVTFTLAELQGMEQYQYVYSCINTWPTKKWYVGKGVKLSDLLARAGMTGDARLLRFTAGDGYTVTLTVKELFQDKRYYFPNFKGNSSKDGDGHVPGSPAGAVEVAPIIGLVSVEGSNNPKYMNGVNSLLLMMGQRAVTEQTGNLFVKYLNKIEALTTEPEKWDAPQANPGSGTVPAGTMVTLSNAHNDDDKIYYTTDGSDPTLNSPMYNWIARRWWSARADALGTINHPIGPIDKNTTIKAITIGPGKLDSDVVTFTYQVAGAGPATGAATVTPGTEQPGSVVGEPAREPVRVIKLTIGQIGASVDGGPYTLDAAPYVDAQAGRTLVPARFISEALGAGVDWNPETRQVTITDGGKEVVLTLGASDVQINGVKQTIDCVPATLPPGRTFVPLRFVSETLGAKVDYEAETGEITITR